jgi:hypothetical protein
MTNRGIGTGIVGYNGQAAVDVQHHLIVAHEVTNSGSDRGQLSGMAQQAQGAMGTPDLEALADRGYYKGEDILACERGGITPSVPKTLTSGAKADGRFGKQDFVYHPEDDTYRCPAGERLTRRCSTVAHGMLLHLYWTTCCERCALKEQCTPGKERRVRRWEHVLDAMQERLDRAPETARLRRRTVEHPFGTIKAWMGATHFLTRTLGAGAHGDEPARARLQPEAGSGDPRAGTAAGSNSIPMKGPGDAQAAHDGLDTSETNIQPCRRAKRPLALVLQPIRGPQG